MTTLTKPTHVLELESLNACQEAIEFAATHPDAESAWAACTRGEWMIWLAGKLSGPQESEGRRKLVACCCECARLSLPVYEQQHPNDMRPRNCLDVAERWSRGEATIEELLDARIAAHEAAYAHEAADASAYAAAYAAAAAAADASAAAAAAASTRSRVLAECANIVRRHYSQPPQIESAALAGKETT